MWLEKTPHSIYVRVILGLCVCVCVGRCIISQLPYTTTNQTIAINCLETK